MSEADKKKEKGKDGKGAEPEKAAPPPPPPTPLEVLHRNLFLLEKYADSRDARFLARVLRYTGFVRGGVSNEDLQKAIETYVLDAAAKTQVLALFTAATADRTVAAAGAKAAAPAPAAAAAAASEDVEMTGPGAAAGVAASGASATGSGAGVASPAAAAPAPGAAGVAAAPKAPPKPSPASQPEVVAYFTLLLLGMLTAQRKWSTAAGAAQAYIASAAETSGASSGVRRPSLDFFVARAHSIWVLALSKGGAESGWPSSPAVHAAASTLLSAYRSAVLRHDDYGAAAYLVACLAIMVAQRDYEAAGRLLARASFPEAASAPLLARYLYYKGRVGAVALDYSEAHSCLLQAIRKAPPSAGGFLVSATRFAILVSLLMGEQPPRDLMTPPAAGGAAAAAALAPYYALAKAVRRGDVAAFGALRASSAARFEADGTAALVARLEATVIKAGLKQIATAYVRIGFAAIATKLALGSAADAEFLVAKAVRDGVIDAEIDHEAGVVTSRETPNVYATSAPAEAFHKRIAFGLDVHAAAVQSMRFPAPVPPADLQSAEAKPKGDDEEDLAAALEGMDDEDDDEDF